METFLKLAQGELIAPCIDEDEAFDEDAFGVSDRDKLTKKQIYKQCKARENTPLSYEYSQVWRIAKDERIDFGRCASRASRTVGCIDSKKDFGGLTRRSLFAQVQQALRRSSQK